MAFADLWGELLLARRNGDPRLRHHDHDAKCGDVGTARPYAGDPRPAGLADVAWEAEGDCAAMLRPAPDGLLRVWLVDRRVGSP